MFNPKQAEKKLRLEKVKSLYKSGLNQGQIAEKLGVNIRTIRRAIVPATALCINILYKY